MAPRSGGRFRPRGERMRVIGRPSGGGARRVDRSDDDHAAPKPTDDHARESRSRSTRPSRSTSAERPASRPPSSTAPRSCSARRSSTCAGSRIRPTRSPPGTARSATRSPATSTTSSGPTSTTATSSTRRVPSRSSTRTATARSRSRPRCTCCRSAAASPDAPDVGGALTQWHVHQDLCLTDDPNQKTLAGFVSVNGVCAPGTSKAGGMPMLHVWVVPNACGPFAALEGVGAGQVPAGQNRLCDTAHGAATG